MALRLGIDLGGTKIELAALDEAGAVRHRERSARGTVGIATPGALSLASGRVKNANSTG